MANERICSSSYAPLLKLRRICSADEVHALYSTRPKGAYTYLRAEGKVEGKGRTSSTKGKEK